MWSRVVPARDSSRGASSWRRRSGRRIATTSTGVGRSRASATRTPASSCSVWRRRRTARIAPAACSRATAAATGCSGRCTRPGSPTSRRRCRSTTDCELTNAWVTAAVKCAPPDNKPLPSERDTCAPFLEREFAALTNARVVVCLGSFGYEAACRHFGVRPRPKFGHGVEVDAATQRRCRPPDHADLLVPPEPAEHVHQTPDRADVRLDLLPRRPARSA